MIVSTEEIVEEFESFGITVKTNQLLEKCIFLCSQYDLAADQLAATWLGYAATNSRDELTLDYLDDFEKDQLAKNKPGSGGSRSSSGVVLPVYTAATIDELQAEEEILLTYGASPVAASKLKGPARRPSDAPVSSPLAKFTSSGGDGTPTTPSARSLLHSSPHLAHLSPSVAKPSQRYSARSNSGAMVSSFVSAGQPKDEFTGRRWTADSALVPDISRTSMANCSSKLMFEKLRETACLEEEAILHMADQIAPAFGGEDSCCWSAMDTPSNEPVQCVGRVCCDSVGRLNAASVLLEGSRELAGAAVLKLDLSNVSDYALFPGQVIGVSGVNTNGSTLVAEKLVAGRVPPFLDHPITISQQTGPVQLVVACGPFTTSDNLLYEPLQDLLNAIARDPPHVLILLGPLLDGNHPLLLDGSVTETYQAVINRVLATVMTALSKCSTEVFVVSSSRDVTSSNVYPTAPLAAPAGGLSPRLHLLSDPSLLVVEGVVLALTAQDVIMDLGKEELAFPAQQGDRMFRLVHHVLAQQSLYPVYPAPDHLCVSPSLLHAHASLNFKPHVLVVPSDIRNFVKDVCGCVTVNPERLCKGMSGGCFARLELRPPSEDLPQQPVVAAAVYRV